MQKAKSFTISKHLVMQAFKDVKANGGAAGIDGLTLQEFEQDLKSNLYKIWNRMSSGSYLPPAVKLVEIPKSGGGIRILGIPAVADRIAQRAAVLEVEPQLEKLFHEDSFGYRPGKSAHQALEVTRKRCWRYDWVLDLDIKAFFDSIDHGLLMKAVEKHTSNRWLLLYISRWLKVPYQKPNGSLIERSQGVPQGSVIGPLLANLFLHYVMDEWMKRNYGHIPFARYADDMVCHCRTESEAQALKEAIQKRFAACKLELNETKTKVIYCKDDDRKGDYAHTGFDFLGYSFRARRSKNRYGKFFVNFTPAISNKAKKRIGTEIRSWKLHLKTDKTLEDLANMFNATIQGWINYYGKFYKSAMYPLFQRLNHRLAYWVERKFKRYRHHKRRGAYWLGRVALQQPSLFAQWKFGVRPPVVSRIPT